MKELITKKEKQVKTLKKQADFSGENHSQKKKGN